MSARLNIGTRFTVLLLVVFVGGIVISGFTLSAAMQRKAEDEISARAEILTQTMNAVRAYTSNNVKPLLAAQLAVSETFIRETVPAYAAREVFERFRQRPEFESFFYKEATLDPTNPRDQADAFETALVQQFREQSGLAKLSGYRMKDGKNLFYIARPLSIQDPSCLQCHSTPAAAPRSQLATFGEHGGFGWELGQIVAAQTIYVPADEVFARGYDYLKLAMGIFAAIFAAVILLINWQLKRSVIRPINRLTDAARHIGTGSVSAEQLGAFDSHDMAIVARRPDEPGELARTFQTMAHEVAARERNLTQAVAERTAQLAETTEEAKRARADAEDANTAKSQFLANMSHELRTPLNAIIGYSEMLKEEAEDAGHDDYGPDLDKVLAAGRHLLSLVNDILDLSRIEAGKVELYLESFDLAAELGHVVSTVKPLLTRNGNTLNVECPADIGTMTADLTKFRQVMFNLLSNAAKFTSEGTITLAVERDGDRVSLRVSDSGIGMNEEQLGRLFQTFSQADASTTRKYGGSGLGLAISRHFCRMMQGDITVTSVAGQGSTFAVTLPMTVVAEQAAPVSAAPAIEGLELPADARSVLVIDDDPSVHDLLRRSLSKAGFHVETAASGPEGLEKARLHKPDVITLDVMMPGMDGWSVLNALKADPELAAIPVIMLTMTSEKTMGYALGAAHFLTKPVNRSEIVALLEQYRDSAERCRVLLVEDDDTTRGMMHRLLEREGVEVGEAGNGRAALEWLETHGAPGLILLDLMMPEMDGFEFVAELQRRPAFESVPVVVLSAKDITEDDRRRLNGGVERILQKGAQNTEQVLGVLHRYLGAYPT